MTPTQKLNLGLTLYILVATVALFWFIATYNGPVLGDGPPSDSYQPTVILP